MNISFKNKKVIVTGGASGIGLAAATMFAAEGADVIVADIQPFKKAPSPGSGSIQFYECDVSDAKAVKGLMDFTKKKFKCLDVLVNNAGIQTYGNVTATSEEDWDRTLNVNVKSAFLCSKYGIPLLLQQRAPVIINVSSVKSFVCQDNEAAYITSKSALTGLTKSIATDYAPRLRCVAVCPGAVRTALLTDEIDKATDKAALIKETEDVHLLKRIAEPEEIANFILFLASEKAAFATGQTYRVDGGIGIRIAGT